METPKAIPQPVAPQPSPPKPPVTADRKPPWQQDRAEPPVVERPAPVATAPARRAETVHWSVVALTFATAVSVVLGAYRGEPSRSRELLPVVVVAQAR